MSIASEIQRIKNNIANAYTAILEKGGVLPSNKNSSNLANTINSISSSAKYGITVDNFLGDVDSNGLYKLPISGTLNATGIKKVDDYGLACKFGGSAWGTTRVQGLTHIIFPDLTYVGNGAMGYFYTYSTDLETISFPELVEIGQCGMQNAFQWNYALKSASFPSYLFQFSSHREALKRSLDLRPHTATGNGQHLAACKTLFPIRFRLEHFLLLLMFPVMQFLHYEEMQYCHRCALHLTKYG